MSDKKIVLKKKSPLLRGVQWVLVSVVSLLLIGYFLVVDTAGGNETPVIGKVNGMPIYYTRDSAFGRSYLQLIENYRSFGIEPTGAILEYIDNLSFRNAVYFMLLTSLAKEEIIVSDNFIVDAMKTQFVDTNGVFNEAQYNLFLTQSTQTDKIKLENDLRDNILVGTIEAELFRRIKPSSLEVKREYMKLNTKRVVEVGYIDVQNMVASKEVDKASLEVYFAENKTNFVQADISIISIPDAQTAEGVYSDISTGIITFADAAKKSSMHTSKEDGGRLGYITKYEIPSFEITDLVFSSTQTNILLPPQYGENTSYIVYLHEIRVPETSSLVNVAILDQEYRNLNAASFIEAEKNSIIAMLNSAIEKGESLESYEILYSTVANPFYYGEDNILDTDGLAIYGTGESIFYNQAFLTPVGSSSSPIKLNTGVAIIKVLSENKPTFDLTNINEAAMLNAQDAQVARITEEWKDLSIAKAKVERNEL